MTAAASDHVRTIYERYAREWDADRGAAGWNDRKWHERFAAHAAAGCVLMFNSGPRFGAAIGEYRGEPLYHASLDASDYRALLDRSGFALLDHVAEDPQAGGRTVWLAQECARLRPAGRL